MMQSAEFDTDFDDGQVNDAEENILVYPGRPALEVICELLRERGVEVGKIRYLEHAGWEVDLRFEGEWMDCRVTAIDRQIVTLGRPSLWSGLFKRPHPKHKAAVLLLADAMAADGRFHNIEWKLDDDIATDKPGHPRPVF